MSLCIEIRLCFQKLVENLFCKTLEMRQEISITCLKHDNIMGNILFMRRKNLCTIIEKNLFLITDPVQLFYLSVSVILFLQIFKIS